MEHIIALEDLKAFCTAALEHEGMESGDARRCAEALAETDAYGTHSHGTKNLHNYIKKFRAGGMDIHAALKVLTDGPAYALLDAQNGMGECASYRAMELAIDVYKRQRQVRELIERQYELFPRLRERHGQDAGTLSGGEQQMLAIGRGLMGRPRLLLLDEPSLGLAPIIVGEVFDTIRRIRDEGITVILVEQNAKKSLSICDYAYVLENGRMVKSGPGRQMLDDPDIAAAYLGVREE